MTSIEIRQSFLDFFKSKQHTVVPSSSLMPDAPNLLFTNAGMNQFVPIFLGQQPCPFSPPRAADTQKCIRAGGKHNDLEDVGLDTYHHTLFEMLGNWSFGNYFKAEAITWAWELITEVWRFPRHRIYATVYAPDKASGDPAEFDQEAHDIWSACFRAAGLDPGVHIVHGNKKDNFWMMGETGPCGPCSELHVDLTPQGDTKGQLVNQGSAECIEIWNLVFIQFNANPDGIFSPLPARHVDTGMGFERVTSIMQNTRGFSDFTRPISNYETDIFRPLFNELEKLSGRHYRSTLPAAGSTGQTDQEKIDVAFRVIADHIRTLSFAIADGILPGNTGRNYVLRRILRRAVRYGRTLGLHQPFFFRLPEVLAASMGEVFPEIRARLDLVKSTIRTEEESFNKTLDTGLEIFQAILSGQKRWQEIARSLERELAATDGKADAQKVGMLKSAQSVPPNLSGDKYLGVYPEELSKTASDLLGSVDVKGLRSACEGIRQHGGEVSGAAAFLLYDTYGFPLDLTELIAREEGFSVERAGFDKLMEEQRERARDSQKRTVISVTNIDTSRPTHFVGFESLLAKACVREVVSANERTGVTVDVSPCYAEMGGQVGDTGAIRAGSQIWRIVETRKVGSTFLHLLEGAEAPAPETIVEISVDEARRAAIQRHHTVTHLLHWALHEVVSREATQKGSFVGSDKLTFDFNSPALSSAQLHDVERLVNERIVENSGVCWIELPYSQVKHRPEVMQFFGDKYGETVRVVQIGGRSGELNGYSMELCGGTHTRATGQIGLFRIVAENAIASGVRRIEAVAGLCAYDRGRRETELIASLAARLNAPVAEIDKRIDSLLSHQKELDKQLKAGQQKQASDAARNLLNRVQTVRGTRAIIEHLGAVDGDYLQAVAEALKGQFDGVVVLGGVGEGGAVAMVASVAPSLTATVQAGKIIQKLAPLVAGKGGGRPDFARGGGKDSSKLAEALQQVEQWI